MSKTALPAPLCGNVVGGNEKRFLDFLTQY
jgi:hypothetical protein